MNGRLFGKFFLVPAALASVLMGCAAIFGWEIHAPGVLSASFYEEPAMEKRVALYIPPEQKGYFSKERGGRFADPQTYYIGESFVPMMIEAFQHTFSEFVLVEAEPEAEVLQRYQIPYLVAVRASGFSNRVTLSGQRLQLESEVVVYDSSLNPVLRYRATGSSDAERVFAKKGGPEVNLNAVIEKNIEAVMNHLRDYFSKEAMLP